jgi:hypothetical protein
MAQQQIVDEIDKTLDQLIQNAKAISNADLQSLSELEVQAFQKTQESLLQHLLSMDQLMVKKQVPNIKESRTASARIREKRASFHALESEYTPRLMEFQEHCSILSKRRKKRFFDPRYKKNTVLVPR